MFLTNSQFSTTNLKCDVEYRVQRTGVQSTEHRVHSTLYRLQRRDYKYVQNTRYSRQTAEYRAQGPVQSTPVSNNAHHLGPPGPSTSQILGTFSRFSETFLAEREEGSPGDPPGP